MLCLRQKGVKLHFPPVLDCPRKIFCVNQDTLGTCLAYAYMQAIDPNILYLDPGIRKFASNLGPDTSLFTLLHYQLCKNFPKYIFKTIYLLKYIFKKLNKNKLT